MDNTNHTDYEEAKAIAEWLTSMPPRERDLARLMMEAFILGMQAHERYESDKKEAQTALTETVRRLREQHKEKRKEWAKE